MRYSRAGLLLAALATAACSESPSAPTAVTTTIAPDVAITAGLTDRRIDYQSFCVLKLREFEDRATQANGHTRVPVDGVGECNVAPFGEAKVRYEGWMNERPEEYVIDGVLVYTFSDGSKLYSNAQIASRAIVALSGGVSFSQGFFRGTGRFISVAGGSGYGTGMMTTPGYRATYTSHGFVAFVDGYPPK